MQAMLECGGLNPTAHPSFMDRYWLSVCTRIDNFLHLVHKFVMLELRHWPLQKRPWAEDSKEAAVEFANRGMPIWLCLQGWTGVEKSPESIADG